MFLSVYNRTSGNQRSYQLNDLNKIKNIKHFLLKLISGPSFNKYFISLVATNDSEIEFIYQNFSNIPQPPTTNKKAIWTGDWAVFILLNYPK